ncbi:MAG: response regulator [Planctomycetaceae bacterium]|nr:response regulator [Planctomycetaceae bacterium]
MIAPKVLVADDSRTIRTQLDLILSQEGIEVITASTGVAALELIFRESPDLAILDINMPELDGYGVCQELMARGTPWNRLPIVFLTSLDSHALEMLGLKMGAYLRKPIVSERVVEVVQSLISVSFEPQ